MILLIIVLSQLFSIMADESKIPIKQCSNCKVKISSDRGEPHSLCGTADSMITVMFVHTPLDVQSASLWMKLAGRNFLL